MVGMQPGSPFYHFGNKQDLLLAVMVEAVVKHANADLSSERRTSFPRKRQSSTVFSIC